MVRTLALFAAALLVSGCSLPEITPADEAIMKRIEKRTLDEFAVSAVAAGPW